jgi:hypothetical protein
LPTVQVHHNQRPEWIGDNFRPVPAIEEFEGWISVGEVRIFQLRWMCFSMIFLVLLQKKQSIDDETQFCDPNILRKILDGKVDIPFDG